MNKLLRLRRRFESPFLKPLYYLFIGAREHYKRLRINLEMLNSILAEHMLLTQSYFVLITIELLLGILKGVGVAIVLFLGLTALIDVALNSLNDIASYIDEFITIYLRQ